MFERDLKAAERILDDAIEEAEHLAPPAPRKRVEDLQPPQAVTEPNSGVQVHVYNVLSQMTTVTTNQVLSALQDLELAGSDRAKAEKLVVEFQREAEGAQRWAKLGTIADRLRRLGGSLYEKVAVPLLLEFLKRQVGVGRR